MEIKRKGLSSMERTKVKAFIFGGVTAPSSNVKSSPNVSTKTNWFEKMAHLCHDQDNLAAKEMVELKGEAEAQCWTFLKVGSFLSKIKSIF